MWSETSHKTKVHQRYCPTAYYDVEILFCVDVTRFHVISDLKLFLPKILSIIIFR